MLVTLLGISKPVRLLHPMKVDSAMLSRMELIRIPLPDKAAREGNLKYAFSKSELQCTMPIEEMAAMTENFDCRDLNSLVENCLKKVFEILKGRYPDGASAAEALRKGEVVLDRELFQEIFDEYMPFPKEADRKRLEAWEKEIYKEKGMPEPEKKTVKMSPADKKDDKGEDEPEAKSPAKPEPFLGMKKGEASEATEKVILNCGSINLALVTADNDGEGAAEKEGFFQDMTEGIDEAGRRNVHNPVPEQEMEKAFFYADKNYPVEGAYWQENAIRYQELLAEEVKKQEKEPELCQKMKEADESLKEKIQPGRKSFYMGQFTEKKGAENFRESYDSFNTVRQGAAVAGFGGTCGIVASCNVVNQQTGKRLREEDGVTVFVSANLCYVDKRFKEAGYRFADDMGWGQRLQIYGNNGGTNFLGRKAFINANGVAFEQIVDTTFMKKGKIFALMKKKPEVTLELMAERFHNGESEILILKAQDLKQASLSNRVPSWQEPDPFRSNHATTVAGFSYTETGEVAGVWINETGGFADSGRVFINAEKFNEMRMNTKGFSVEFTKKKEQGGEA